MSPQKIRYTKLVRIVDRLRYQMPWKKRYPFCNLKRDVRPFFIIGSGRSGNTLLRAMLVAHGRLAIPPESYVLASIVREFNRYNYLPWPMLVRLVVSRFESHPQFHTWDTDLMPVYKDALALPPEKCTLAELLDLIYRRYMTIKFPDANRWGDKTPLNTLRLDEISLVFPNAQYIHILRDGRDVVASYLAAGLYKSVDDAATRWVKSVERAQMFERRWGHGRYLEIRYEKLVINPSTVLTEICHFLGIVYNPAMLNYWQYAEKLGDVSLSHHANVRRPVSTQSVGQWTKRLTVSDQNRAQEILGSKLLALGYET